MSSLNRRRDRDVMELEMNDYVVELINNRYDEIIVEFPGPKESPYEGGVWNVRVELLDDYPFQSPSIGFVNKIFHPNIEELSGSVCLDAINEEWSEVYTLLTVFEIFLPRLLLDPNPLDPMNHNAASLMIKDNAQYEQRVREYCERYAKKELTDDELTDESEGEASDDEALSDKQSESDVGEASDDEALSDKQSESDVGEASDDEALSDKQSESGEGEASDDEALSDEESESGDDIAGHADP